ncbi:MAG: hypothetical protein LUE64_05370 [Candidatus Gastranaerophilales bacterium]|nr:hypothetical protein [Candidatus Gastranaerophilales bacterium]
MKKISAMVLAEVVMAILICAIIVGASVCVFKSNDVTKSPFIFSVLKNLPDANKLVMEDCYNAGGCSSPTSLPDSTLQYCTRIADMVGTSGEVVCTSSGSSSYKYSSMGMNFKLTNGVAFYNMTASWSTLSSNVSISYIDAYIDINGPKNGDNKLCSDIFPIRIFKNGAVVPSPKKTISGTSCSPYTDDEFFTYRVILNRASDSSNQNSRIKEIVDTTSGVTTGSNLPFRERVSFLEALCVSNPDDITNYYTSSEATCSAYSLLDDCDFSDSSNPYYDDKSAYCTVEPVKPRGTGIFKIFGI